MVRDRWRLIHLPIQPMSVLGSAIHTLRGSPLIRKMTGGGLFWVSSIHLIWSGPLVVELKNGHTISIALETTVYIPAKHRLTVLLARMLSSPNYGLAMRQQGLSSMAVPEPDLLGSVDNIFRPLVEGAPVPAPRAEVSGTKWFVANGHKTVVHY